MQREPRHVRKVSNAACRRCDTQGGTLVRLIDGYLYCFPCLREEDPNTFEQLQDWVDAHRIPKRA